MSTCSDSRVDTPEAAAAEIEVTPVWEAFIVDGSGFVVSDHEDLDEIISLFPDEMAIEGRFGDVFPEQIVIVTGTAAPTPMGASKRMPSSHYTEDKVFEHDLDMAETSEELRTVWERAKAMAEGLNAYVARKGCQ